MKRNKHLKLAFILVFSFLSADSFALPSEEGVRGIQTLCGAGNIQSASFKGNVDAAIKSWRNASVDASLEVAKSNLTGALTQIKNDTNLAPVFKIYVDCVKETLQQFLDKENNKPRNVSAVGKSSALLRSGFASDDDMWKTGCEEAKVDASTGLAATCPDGTPAILRTSCPQVEGSPRTYTASIEALCSTK